MSVGTLPPETEKLLKRLTILEGGHSYDQAAEKQFCIMEACAFVAGEPHSANPVCVSPIIASFLIEINDSRTSNAERNKLKKVIPEIMGTRPTRKTKGRFWSTLKGEYVEGEYTVTKETKGYTAAEGRRRRRLIKECQVRGYMEGDYTDEDSSFSEDYIGFSSIPTKAAIEIARILAGIKNKV